MVLAAKVERAVSIKARLIGLLGRRELPEGAALVIEPCSSIHTFFMRFQIDVVFLDKDCVVHRAISSMKPWRATRLYPSAVLAVELPAGILARTGTGKGDLLAFVD